MVPSDNRQASPFPPQSQQGSQSNSQSNSNNNIYNNQGHFSPPSSQLAQYPPTNPYNNQPSAYSEEDGGIQYNAEQQQQQQPMANTIPSRRRAYPAGIANAYQVQPQLPQPPFAAQPPIQQQQQQVYQTSPSPQYPQQQPAQYPQPVQQQQYGAPQLAAFSNYGQQPQIHQITQQMSSMNVSSGHLAAAAVAVPTATPAQLLAQLHQYPQPPRTAVPTATNYPVNTAPPSLQRCTINVLPQTYGLLSKSRIPLGLLLHPFKALEEGEVVPVIGATSRQDPQQPVYAAQSIVRCRRCRTYINPFVQFVDQMNWRCPMCFMLNDVPQFFDYDAQTQQYSDRFARPEVTYAAVEYVAPDEYMVRAPQAPAFVFIVDVSFAAVSSGMLATFARTLADCLDQIPNDEHRTRFALITVDSSVHFYNFETESGEAEMLVVTDVQDVFLPLPDGLLVSLGDCQATIEGLLHKLNTMFQSTQCTLSALGAAVQAALKLTSANGGKIVIFQANMPNIEPGALKARESPKVLGTAAESALLQPDSSFYKSLAVDCSRSQITIDMFLFGSQYMDLASLVGASRYTAGSVYHYPGFNAIRPEDAFKFASELCHFLSRPMGMEAVLRVRCTKGLRCEAFHGNFFVRSSDLLALPSVSPDNSYAFQLAMDENLSTGMAVMQSALLYTTHFGERRIRVVTTAYPLTQDLMEIYRSIDSMALGSLLCKMAVERAVNSRLEDAREALVNKLVDLCAVSAKSLYGHSGTVMQPQLLVPESLLPLPVLIFAMIKHLSIRPGSQTPSDMRTAAMSLLRILPCELLMTHLYPTLYELHSMSPDVGLPQTEDGGGGGGAAVAGIRMPPAAVNLSSERLVRHGIYLMDCLDRLYLFIGRSVHPQVIQELFGKQSVDQLVAGKFTLPIHSDPGPSQLNRRVNAIIGKLRENPQRRFLYPDLFLVKEDGGDALLRMLFLSALIEDRQDIGPSLPQFLNEIRERVQKTNV